MKTSKTAVAIGYARVSTEEQAKHGISLDAQQERIRAYCVMQGLTLREIISEEGVSAGKALLSRPGGQRLAQAKAGHIVALKLDRLFRDAADALNQTRDWDKNDIALHLVDMGGATVNTKSAMGRMFITMMAGFAELERNVIAERTATALQHKKSHRKVYGPTPFGFARDGDSLEDAAEEQFIVVRIQGWRSEGWTYRAIADALNSMNVTRKRGGKQWYASTVQKIVGNKLHEGFGNQ